MCFLSAYIFQMGLLKPSILLSSYGGPSCCTNMLHRKNLPYCSRKRRAIPCHMQATLSSRTFVANTILYYPHLEFFSALYVPKFFELEWTTVLEEKNGTNISTKQIMPTEMRTNPYYFQIYFLWSNFIINGLMPFILLIVLNVMIPVSYTHLTLPTNREV